MKTSSGREISYGDVRHVHSVVTCGQPFHHRYDDHNGFEVTFVVLKDFADDAKLWDIVLEIEAEWIELDHWVGTGAEGEDTPGPNWCHPQKNLAQHFEWKKRDFTLRDLLCWFNECPGWYGRRMFDRSLEERGIVHLYLEHTDTITGFDGDLVLVPLPTEETS